MKKSTTLMMHDKKGRSIRIRIETGHRKWGTRRQSRIKKEDPLE